MIAMLLAASVWQLQFNVTKGTTKIGSLMPAASQSVFSTSAECVAEGKKAAPWYRANSPASSKLRPTMTWKPICAKRALNAADSEQLERWAWVHSMSHEMHDMPGM